MTPYGVVYYFRHHRCPIVTPKNGQNSEESADALAALLDILQIDKIFLIAISAAIPTALAFCFKYPDCVKKLITECTVAKEWD